MRIFELIFFLLLTKMYQYKYTSGKILNRTKCAREHKFLLNTTGCQIPDMPVKFKDAETKPISCGQREIHIERSSNNNIRFLMTRNIYPCCYSYILRGTEFTFQDYRVEYTTCLPFLNGTKAILKNDLIVIKCGKSYLNPDYEDYFAFATQRDENFKPKYKSKPYNVVVLGVDSMSRARAYNSLPKTVQFMKNESWLDFQAYNKVSKSTTGNLIALLTGRRIDQKGSKKFRPICFSDISVCNSLMIWYRYQIEEYVTSLATDGAYLGNIIDIRNGFIRTPTDHYIRPLFLDGEKKINNNACTGKISSTQQILDYLLDFVTTNKNRKFFGLFWTLTVGSQIGQSPKSHDAAFLDLFTKLKQTGVLDNTFVFFISDQGILYGDVKNQMESYYEERLPMFFMSVPKIMQKKQKKMFNNLKKNQYRLVSPFDVHLTLINILHIKARKSYLKADSCRYCTSLFYNIPTERHCTCAGIEEHWCTCHRMKETSEKDYDARMSLSLAKKKVFDIPTKVATQPCTSCHQMFFRGSLRMHSYSYQNDEIEKYFVFAFVVSPEETFEVVVKRGKKSYDMVSADVISDFKNQGYCVVRPQDKYSCVCRSDKACWMGMHLWPEYKETIFKPKLLANVRPWTVKTENWVG